MLRLPSLIDVSVTARIVSRFSNFWQPQLRGVAKTPNIFAHEHHKTNDSRMILFGHRKLAWIDVIPDSAKEGHRVVLFEQPDGTAEAREHKLRYQDGTDGFHWPGWRATNRLPSNATSPNFLDEVYAGLVKLQEILNDPDLGNIYPEWDREERYIQHYLAWATTVLNRAISPG